MTTTRNSALHLARQPRQRAKEQTASWGVTGHLAPACGPTTQSAQISKSRETSCLSLYDRHARRYLKEGKGTLHPNSCLKPGCLWQLWDSADFKHLKGPQKLPKNDFGGRGHRGSEPREAVWESRHLDDASWLCEGGDRIGGKRS